MPVSRLSVACCQFPVSNDTSKNASVIRAQIANAAGSGADVVHFAELALSGVGYSHRRDDLWKTSWQRWDWSLIRAELETIREACRFHGIWVVLGSPHSFDVAERPTNAVYVFDDKGDVVTRYDKRRCSESDLHNYTPGETAVMFEIKGVSCGLAICLEWSFPDIFADYAEAGIDLLFLSAYSAGNNDDTIHSHTIPQTIQGHAFTTNMFISVANNANRQQSFPSFWTKRSGKMGGKCRRNVTGMVIGDLPDEPEEDELYRFIRKFRHACRDGSFYSGHRTKNPKINDRRSL